MNADIEIERFEKYDQVIVNEKGELLTIPLRRGLADSAFIDQITFRIHKDSLHRFSRGTTFLAKDSDFIEQISFELLQIFGFGVSHKLKHSGGRFYDDCYQMGDEAVQYGRVHIGGNNDTILVEMTATGCMAALNGWESRLYDFIIKCYGARITRIDLAKDFFNGEYSPEQAKQDRLDGLLPVIVRVCLRVNQLAQIGNQIPKKAKPITLVPVNPRAMFVFTKKVNSLAM